MDSRKISGFALVLTTITFLVPFCTVADEADTHGLTVLPQLPYTAQITGDNVYIRSGAGTNFYRCGKLYKGDTVRVVSRQDTWSQIMPTPKSFSWISKRYVIIDKTNPDTGEVTSDNVSVYAGSEYIEPIHSNVAQLKLNNGDKVTLLGEEIEDYYKIKPPAGTYFWVSTQYTQPVAVSKPVIHRPEPFEIKTTPKVTEPVKPKLKLPEPETAVVPSNVTENSETAKRLKKYYLLQDMVKAQYAKPLLQQDYSKPKQGLNELIKQDKTDKAARYAEFLISQIDRFALAAQVEKESKLQNSQLQQTIERIDTAHTERKADFKDTGQYAVIGTIKKSNVYGPEKVLLHYTVVDDNGKIICYALPSGSAGLTDMESFVGKKVGLIGTIQPHPQTSGALVKFTAIENIN